MLDISTNQYQNCHKVHYTRGVVGIFMGRKTQFIRAHYITLGPYPTRFFYKI